MATGEETNALQITCSPKVIETSGESPLDAYNLELLVAEDAESAYARSGVSNLYEIPARIRIQIWKYLDKSDRKSVSETCKRFRHELLSLNEDYSLVSPFQNFIHMLPFVPLHRYLDVASRKAMRLVCKDLKTIMDYVNLDDRRRRERCRWGDVAVTSSRENFTEFGENELSAQTPATCIFDLNIQDLKRIFSQLEKNDYNSLKNTCLIFKHIIQELVDYQFQEFQENFSQLNLMDLPFEVHERILDVCNSRDRQKLRLVSKLMQFQVDTLAGVEVHLNDLKWSWNRKNGCGKLPPAYSLIIANVENIQAVKYFTNEDNSKLLTRIVVDGKFPPRAFIHVLERCKNLRYIGFTHALQMSSVEDEIRKSFPVKRLPFELNSLRALNLKIQDKDFPSNNIFRVHSWTWANAFEFMKPGLFLMPRLTSFSLCEEAIISHNLMYEVAEKVLKFIMDHRHTLKYVSVILNGNCLRSCGCPPFPFQIKESVTKELKLAKFSHDCDWRISRPFTAILSTQRLLQQLTCFKLSDWEFYAGVIFNNRHTLRSVTIEKNFAPIIDLNAFSACANLEHLSISQCGLSNFGQQNCTYLRTIRVDQRLINLDALPTSLKSLHILDQTVDVSQIKTIPYRLKKLEILDLQFIGSWDGQSFGLPAETVLEILQLRKLQCLFLEEIRTMEAYFTRSFETALSEINLIPSECSQVIKSYGCVAHGILIAQRIPDTDFMPEWQQRVSCYLDTIMFNDDNFIHEHEVFDESGENLSSLDEDSDM